MLALPPYLRKAFRATIAALRSARATGGMGSEPARSSHGAVFAPTGRAPFNRVAGGKGLALTPAEKHLFGCLGKGFLRGCQCVAS